MSLSLIVNILLCTSVVVGIVGLLAGSIRTSHGNGQHAARRLRAERAGARRPAPRGGYARPYAS